jgi:hypothetical protein
MAGDGDGAAAGGAKKQHGWFGPLACAIDVAVGVFLCVVAYRALTVTPLTFQNIVLGVVEFIVGCACGLAALVKLDVVNRHYHALYTYSGKGLFYVLFGTLGLSGDPLKYIFAGATIAVGMLWLIVGCLWRQTPAPFCDLTSGDAPPRARAQAAAAAAPPGAGAGAPKEAASAGTAAFGESGASGPSHRPDNPFAPPAGHAGGSLGDRVHAAAAEPPAAAAANPFGFGRGGGGGKKAGGGKGSSSAAWS